MYNNFPRSSPTNRLHMPGPSLNGRRELYPQYGLSYDERQSSIERDGSPNLYGENPYNTFQRRSSPSGEVPIFPTNENFFNSNPK